MKPERHHICEYYCPECSGEGYTECPRCGSDEDCKECGGTGFDPELIDFKEFQQALKRFEEIDRKVGGRGQVEELFETVTNGPGNQIAVFVGIKTAVGVVRFSDFDKDNSERTKLQEPDTSFGVAQGGHKSLLEDLP